MLKNHVKNAAAPGSVPTCVQLKVRNNLKSLLKLLKGCHSQGTSSHLENTGSLNKSLNLREKRPS